LLSYNYIASVGQLSLQVQMDGFRSQMQKQPSGTMSRLTQLQNKILAELEHAKVEQVPLSSISDATVFASDIGTTSFGERLRLLEEIRGKLGVAIEGKQEPSPEIWIL